MARFPLSFTLGALASLIALACASQPGDTGGGGGSGGAAGPSSGGTSSGSGGQSSAGGTGTGGTSTGGTSSGGNEGDGDGGLGGETATGGADASGGAEGVGGSGGAPAVGYAECDQDLGGEGNPDCAEGEVCANNVCAETCPTDLNDAAVYDCPESPGGEALSQCSFVLGRCTLICEAQGGPTYACPDGMTCELAHCVWPS